jgi:hypothetical protein
MAAESPNGEGDRFQSERERAFPSERERAFPAAELRVDLREALSEGNGQPPEPREPTPLPEASDPPPADPP